MARLSRALRHRNYRLFFFGQGVSLVGTWLTRFATSWLAYRLTGSGLVLGLVTFFNQAPAAALAPLAGVLVDRWNRHRVIVVTQALAMLQSAALAVFTFTHLMTVWLLLLLGAVQALINAFDMPARQSFLGQMVDDREDLPNAIALNSSMVNGARLLGPVFGAALVDFFGEAWCFAIDAVTYIAVIASLLMMTVQVRSRLIAAKPKRGVLHEMAEGWRYVMRAPLVRSVLLLLVVTSMLGGAYQTLLPLVAGTTFRGGPNTAGILMGAAGCGALAGALYLAGRSSTVGLPRVIANATTTLGVALCLLCFTRSVWTAAPVLLACGLGLMVQMASTNTIIQSTVETGVLGRVLSIYAMAFFGGMPLGALLLGWVADRVGPMDAFCFAGIAVLVGATAFRFVLPKLDEGVLPAARVA